MTDIPRPEHPQPNFQRPAWTTLNGAWRFRFDPDAVGEHLRWYAPGQPQEQTIIVPYPWESRLSGVMVPDYKGAAWYEREFTVPAEWADLVPMLHFGAVDWHARVWINGQLAAEHDNGYLPFAIDLRPFVQPGETATVTVRAYDIADAATLVGKQAPRWYTYSSGIWQSVWLEGRQPSHIAALRVEPRLEREQAIVQLTLTVEEPGAYEMRLRSIDGAFPPIVARQIFDAGSHDVTLILAVLDPQPWSPESPALYDFEAEFESPSGRVDRVQSYFGMRSVGRTAWDGKKYEYITLNGEPVYLRGALDQAFHPDGLHAYPSDEVIRGDIQLAKDLGLNMLRCHIKINDPRYYYWADRLGLLIMYDLPSPDLDSPSMRRTFERTLRQVIARDYNSPAIFSWVLFNETWGLTKHDTPDGQQWVQDMVRLAKELDPMRLIEDNSACRYDHVESDINSWHFYINDYRRARQHIQRVVDETYAGSAFNYVGGDYVQQTAPLINSEYAGISARMGDQDIAWSFKYLTTDMRRHDKICGYIYTELDDIEWEHNGFVNYDRSAKEFGYDFFVPEMSVADLTGADLVGLDAPPCQTLPPGATFAAPLFVSHWGESLGKGEVRWQLDFSDRFGARCTVQEGSLPVEVARFHVSDLGELSVRLPDEAGLAMLALALADERGAVRCRNYVNVEVRAEAVSPVEALPNGWALRFTPGHFTQTSWVWPVPYAAPDGGKFSATGAGWVEYAVPVPAEADANAVQRLRLLFEAGARAGMSKVDWPERMYGLNYPQTETDKKHPSRVAVSINDVALGEVDLPDDPADARGALSHHHGVDPGSYGYLTELVLEGDALAQALAGATVLRVRFTVPDEAEGLRVYGGLALYGETLGRYPLSPTVLLETGA